MNNVDDPLAGLPREVTPPGPLKTRVRATLRQRGLVVPSRPARLGRAAGAAAAGVLIGRETARPAASPPDARPRFLLLLYEDSAFAAGGTGARVAEYSAWADSLARRRLLVSAGKLSDTGSVVLSPTGRGLRLSPGDVTSSAGNVTGFFIIRAADEAEAIAVAGTLPHLRHRGRVALRPIDPADAAVDGWVGGRDVGC